MTEIKDDEDQIKSKSQIKREMVELRKLGEKLLDLPIEQVQRLSDQNLIEAVLSAKKMTSHVARKRQLQFIGKLMRKTELSEVTNLIDLFDTKTRENAHHFHRLERWREQLIANDDTVMTEIYLECPHADRQHLRQLTRQAITEANKGNGGHAHARKLFAYLRDLIEHAPEF